MVKFHTVGRNDSATLLPPMLKSIEAQVSDVGSFRVIIDTKDPAHLDLPPDGLSKRN
jgi:hypothetical protein